MRLTLPLLLVMAPLAGCIGPPGSAADAGPPSEPATADPWPRCAHPWPCGDGSEWPSGLAGPFDLLDEADRRRRVEAPDGVTLAGWVYRPDVPEGVTVPLVLYASIYLGSVYPGPDTWGSAFGNPSVHYLPEDLVAAGYAVAAFGMRGTGLSGGCFEFWDPLWPGDLAAVLDALAAEPWSNGRIGMMGLSSDALDAVIAATTGHTALKTIVPFATAPMSIYTILHTPQGAKDRVLVPVWTSDAPPIVGPASAGDLVEQLAATPCPVSTGWRTIPARSLASDERDAGFYAARDFTPGLRNVTAAMLLTRGVFDRGPLGGFQAKAMSEDNVWDGVQSPKRLLIGPWGHTDPSGGLGVQIGPWQDAARVQAWLSTLIAWYDFWLKGVGEAPALSAVEYSAHEGDVRRSAAWPPAEARPEVLYLSADGALAVVPADGEASYRSAPLGGVPTTGYGNEMTGLYSETTRGPAALACDVTGADAAGAVFRSAPLGSDAMLAGTPLAYLWLESDNAGGVVTTYLFDVRPAVGTDPCEARYLAAGAANLRLHAGGYDPSDFPVGRAVPVRMDMPGIVTAVPRGHLIVAVVSAGDPADFAQHPEAGTISVLGDGTGASSHVVLPFVEGSLGGQPPALMYPVRPFSPGWYQRPGPGGPDGGTSTMDDFLTAPP